MKFFCLHAHGSNGSYLERLFQNHPVVLEHQVYCLPKGVGQLTGPELETIIAEKMSEDVTGIVITCTLYSSLIEGNGIEQRPVFKIENPIINRIVCDNRDKLLFFSNPTTVALTMSKVEKLYEAQGKAIDYQVVVIPKIFPLILANRKMEYREALINSVSQYVGVGAGAVGIYLMQLSMSVVNEADFLVGEQTILTVYEAAAANLQAFWG